MGINQLHHLKLVAALGFAAGVSTLVAATGTISADPNPCFIAPGTHQCTTVVRWSTQGTEHVRVWVRSEGTKESPEREFAARLFCERCEANWIEPHTRYIFTLVDSSGGGRGSVLGSVTVTAMEGGDAPRPGPLTGTIRAEPNPCRIERGRPDCTTYLSWTATGPHARVYVREEGPKPSPEREFATGHVGDRVSATWIGPDNRYVFTLVDFSDGTRGRELARVVVTGVR